MGMRFITTTIAILALVAPLQAQSISIDELHRKFAGQSDIAELRKLDFDLNRRTSTSSDAMIERGMLLLRLHELTRDDHDAKVAHDMFERAAKKLPDDPRVYYGLALSRLGGYGVRIPSPFGVLNRVVMAQSAAEILKHDPASLAKNDLKKALALDLNLAGAAILLAQVSIDTRDRDNLQAAANALKPMVDAQRGGPDVATALSQVEAALGDVQAATKAAESATDLAAGSTDSSAIASAALARAIALLRQPGREDAGATAYFDGLSSLTEQSANGYFSGIAPIVSEAEKDAWTAAPLEAKKAWLRKFWGTRAAASGITVGERLAEHYRRLATAQERYRHQSGRGAQPEGSLVAAANSQRDLPFDDRGLIYVRHGEPKTIVRTSHEELRPNETWVYNENGKNQLYNFVVLRNGADYRLVDDVLKAIDNNQGWLPVDAATKLLRDREMYDPRYGAMAERFDSFDRRQNINGMIDPNSLAFQRSEWGQDIMLSETRIAADRRADALVALTTDTDEPDFKADLPFYYDLYAFKGENGLTDVTAAAAVPGTSLFSQKRGDQYIYSLRASLIFIDTATNEISRRDTTYNFWSTRVLGTNEYLRVTVNMSVPFAKAAQHRIVLRDLIDPGAGQLYGGPSELKNFAGPSLMASDIVLAESDDGVWNRGLAHLGLVPPRQFAENKPLKVFYELYNLPAETPYRTEIDMMPVEGETGFGRLKKLFGAKGSGIHLSFEGMAQPNADGTVQELRQITTQVKPGKYRIEVRVTNLTNQQSVRTATVFVVSKKL